MTTEDLHAFFLKHPRVSTDSRSIPQDGIFFALKGPNFNGNTFAAEALSKGAALAIVDEETYAGPQACILVSDVLETLQRLAAYHRDYCATRVIALTGSNGKTTTKELIASVLSKKYETLATSGNLNNHIGVPLTLLRLKPETEMAVVEMGANHQGEIAFLSRIARPDFGYITNFGKAHLEGFGGVEGVIRGKSELYRDLMERGKVVFMNADDPIQVEKLSAYPKTVGFSNSRPDYVAIRDLGADPFVCLEFEGQRIETQLMGRYNFANCAAAALIGKYFSVPPDAIREALEAYRPRNNRSQILHCGDLTILLDAYNANPTSMAAALDHLEQIVAPRKLAILGDMFELGDSAAAEHRSIGELALTKKLDQIYLAGENFDRTGLPVPRFKDFEALAAALRKDPIQGPATVLIKGSRGMALERILEVLGPVTD